jgi:hypothetical protein
MDSRNLETLDEKRVDARPGARDRRSSPRMVTPLSVVTRSPGTVPSQLPPASAARSTTTEPGLSRDRALREMRRGAGWGKGPGRSRFARGTLLLTHHPPTYLSRNHRGGDDDVDVGRLRFKERPLGGEKRVAHRLGITAAAFPGFLNAHGQKLGPHGRRLLGDGGPGVENAYHRAEPTRTARRRQPRDAAPDDEHFDGRDAAGGGGLAGHEAGEGGRGFDDGAGAGDVGLRREHVKRLRARQGAWDEVDADGRGAFGLERGEQARVGGVERRDEDAAVFQQGRLGGRRRRAHLEDDVRAECRLAGGEGRAGGRVGRVGDARARASARLHDDALEPRFQQRGSSSGRERDAGLAGVRLLGHA